MSRTATGGAPVYRGTNDYTKSAGSPSSPIGADYAALMPNSPPLSNPITRIRHAVLVFVWVFVGTLAYTLIVTGTAASVTSDPLASTTLKALSVGVATFLTAFFLTYLFKPVDGFHANWFITFNVYVSYVLNPKPHGFRAASLVRKLLAGGLYFLVYVCLQLVAALSASFFLQYLLNGEIGDLGFPSPSVSNGRIALISWFGSTLIGLAYHYGMFVERTPNNSSGYAAALGAVTGSAFPLIGLGFNPILYFGPAIAVGSVSKAVEYVLVAWTGYLTALLIFEIDRHILRAHQIYVGWAPFTYEVHRHAKMEKGEK